MAELLKRKNQAEIQPGPLRDRDIFPSSSGFFPKEAMVFKREATSVNLITHCIVLQDCHYFAQGVRDDCG